jgi:phage N-6-adenine-methyltransferase
MTLALFDSADIVVDEDRDTWCTPQEIVDALLRLWPKGPDLDPCANDRSIVPCRRRYTIADCLDPEAQEWRVNERVYCNPPFSNTGPWARKLAAIECLEAVACVLCDPSVGWWREIWTADAVGFPDHRLRYIPPPGVKVSGNDRPSALPYWGAQAHAFKAAFEPLGKVVFP